MSVLITNTVLLNGGDAAILEALERQVEKVFGPDAGVVIADTQPDIARHYYPDRTIIPPLYLHAFPPKRDGTFPKLSGALRYARWYTSLPRLYAAAYALGRGARGTARLLTTSDEWASLRAYADADVIVSTGGTYLVENYWLAPRLFDFRISLLLGKPLVLYTQSMGPFESNSVRSALKDIFRNCALILLRDEASLAHIHELCDPNEVNASLSADAAFALADEETVTAAATGRAHDGLRVAVSVRKWTYFQDVTPEEGMERYLGAVTALVEHLVSEHGASVEFLSTCQGVRGYAYDDSAVAQEVLERLPLDMRESITVNREHHRPVELLKRLSEFDLVVATRMHMAILALAAGIPVLPISYEFKTRALFERLGMGEYVHDIENVDPLELSSSADDLIENMASIRQRLFPRVEKERRRAAAAEEYLDMVRRTWVGDSDHEA